MRKKTDWMDGIDDWKLGLEKFVVATTEPVNLANLNKIRGVKVSACENGAWRYEIPVDDQEPERPCDTTLLVSTHTNGKNPGVVRTEIEMGPFFYHRNDPGEFLHRILKVDPGFFTIQVINLSAGGNFGTLAEPKLGKLVFFPQGFLLEREEPA